MAGSVSLLSASVLFLSVVGVLSEYYKTGSTLTLNPALQGKAENILWKLNNDKVVEFDGTADDWYKFEGRAGLNHATGQFTLQNLTPSDSGEYLSEIQVDKKLKYSRHQVVVMDPVPEPEVKCLTKDQGHVELKCSINPPVSAFSWTGPEDFKSTNQSIDVSWVAGAIYFCSVENKVSNSYKEFNLNDCSKGSPEPSPAVAIGVTIAVIAFICAGIFGFRQRKKLLAFCPFNKKPETPDKPEDNDLLSGGPSGELPKADETNKH